MWMRRGAQSSQAVAYQINHRKGVHLTPLPTQTLESQ